MATGCPTPDGVSPDHPPCHPHRPSWPHLADRWLGRASLVEDRGDQSPKGRPNFLLVRHPVPWHCLTPEAMPGCPAVLLPSGTRFQAATCRAGTLFLKGSCSLCPDRKVDREHSETSGLDGSNQVGSRGRSGSRRGRAPSSGRPGLSREKTEVLVWFAGLPAYSHLQPPGGERSAWFGSEHPGSGQLQG